MNKIKLLIIIAAVSGLYHPFSAFSQQAAVTEQELQRAEKMEDCPEKAAVFYESGKFQLNHGSPAKAQEYLTKALRIFEKSDGRQSEAFSCLYMLSYTYLSMNDWNGLERNIRQMELLAQKSPAPMDLFSLYSVKQVYFGDRAMRNPEDAALADSSLFYAKKTLEVIENKYEELSGLNTPPFYNYYNLAVLYLEINTDSARHYLQKAEKWIYTPDHPESETVTMRIVTANVYAWALFFDGKYSEAESKMLEALTLLQEIDNDLVIAEFADTYNFFVQLYEKTNRPELALKYQKLFTEKELQRLDVEKTQALHEIATRYETEKKEARILELEAQKKIFILTVIAIVIVCGLILALYFVLRLRHKNLQQELYEAVLSAELSRQEKEQQPEQNRSLVSVHKVIGFIETSLLPNANKETYITKLKGVNLELLDNIIASCNGKITSIDMKYMVCFTIDMDVKDIAGMFNIEVASVYSVRYRIRKKYKVNL
jgi:hypothetical protein